MLILFVCVFLLGSLLTGLIRAYALARRVLDIPNQRSSHTIPTARGGGLAIVAAFFAATAYLISTQQLDILWFYTLSPALLVAMIGFWDDHAHVPARWRLLIHVLAAVLVLLSLNGLPLIVAPAPFDAIIGHRLIYLGAAGFFLGVIFLVWQVNLFNFMDGTDGIAASEALFVSSALAGYLYPINQALFYLNGILAAASLGFLIWNWPRAKIFMGDAGSGFLGMMLGVLILMAAHQAPILLDCGLILFATFVADASYTLLVRFLTGQKWYDAHCSHTYQQAAKRHGHSRVLLANWAINLLWLLPISSWVFFHPSHALLGLLAAYSPLLLLASHFKAGRTETVKQ